MANIMLGEKAGRAIDKILWSNDMILRRIISLASNVEEQLITRVRGSSYFALLLDESTDVENFCQLLAYVRYIYENEVYDDHSFCLSLKLTVQEMIFLVWLMIIS
jgi:hypothetical protein